MSTRTARRTRTERGAAAVESVILLGMVLMPLLLGVITYGSYFWQAQRVEPIAAELPMDNIVGEYNCAELTDRIKTTAVNNLPALSTAVGVPDLNAIGVKVVNVLPTVGVDVVVSIRIPATNQLGGLVPLPEGGNVVSEATYRLDNVRLTTAGC